MAKKVKYPPTTTPKTNPAKGKSGSAAKLSRDSKGNLKATLKSDFAGVSQETMRQDRRAKAGTGDGTYNGAPAPRVGGKQKPIAPSGNVRGGTKSMLKASKKRVNKSAASASAKKAAKKLY
ncbi:MAG TPA: hypothetical protein VGD26_01575 [Chitinophagaceae bacterium]